MAETATKPGVRAMIALMREISEREWAAGWNTGLERILWAEVQGSKPLLHLTLDEAEELAWLSEQVDGWVEWRDDADGPTFVPLTEWVA